MTWRPVFPDYAQGYFERHLMPLAGAKGLRFLQLGAAAGDVSRWLLDNVLTDPSSVLYDVDAFMGNPENDGDLLFADVEAEYHARINPDEEPRVRLQVGTTFDALALFQLQRVAPFHFVYVDAGHDELNTLRDALLAWDLVLPLGLIAFDDYSRRWDPVTDTYQPWAEYGDSCFENPIHAIDAFRHVVKDKTTQIASGDQLWLRRVS